MPFMKVSGNHNSTSKKAVSFNTQDGSDEKIDNHTSMKSKLINKTHNSSPKYTKKGENRPGMTIIKVTTGLEIDNLVEIEGHCTEVEVDLDKIMARTLGKIIEGELGTIIEMTLGEKIIIVKIIETEVEVETIAGTYRENYG